MPPETTVRAGRRRVRLTNPDKVLFPADGITKADLADYYAAVAPAMVPHVRDRPLNLWRWNTASSATSSSSRRSPAARPTGCGACGSPRRRGGTVCHAVGGETATLAWLANQNCITPHAWTSRADRPDRPDRLVFDLDPPDDDRDATSRRSAPARSSSGTLLRELGLAPFAMTSGSRGLHVVAPLRRGAHADAARATRGRDRRAARRAPAGRADDRVAQGEARRPRARRRRPQHVRADHRGALRGPGARPARRWPPRWRGRSSTTPSCTRAAGRSPPCRSALASAATRGRGSRAAARPLPPSG